jgi:4-amino-4-deoxy-L-arabinose transferase-like glycosyltransferase
MQQVFPGRGFVHTVATFAQTQKRLVLILTLGLAVRLVWLWALGEQPLWMDEPEYLDIAHALRAGGYLDDYLWLRTPLFPAWLALVLGPGEQLWLARLAQIALGLLLIFLLYRVALVAWQDERSAELAALLAALYLPLVAYANYLMAETLLLVVLCMLLLTLLAALRAPSFKRAALAGGLLGMAALIKPIGLVLLPTLLLVFWWNRQPWRWRAGATVLLLAVCMAVIAPWSLRNALVHQRFILLDTTGGFNLWFGNQALAEQTDPFFVQTVNASEPNLADRDRVFAQRGQELLQQDAAQTLTYLFTDKLARFWRLQTDLVVTQEQGQLALRCPIEGPDGTYGILLPGDLAELRSTRACWWQWLNVLADMVYLALLLGLLVTTFFVRQPRLIALAWLWILPICLITIITVVQPRLRLPMLPVLLPWAAAGLVLLRDGWARHLGGGAWRQRAQWASLLRQWRVVAVLLLALAGLWVLKLPHLLGSQVSVLVGDSAWQRGDTQAALAAYQTAAAWYPEHIYALVSAGQLAEIMRRDNLALGWYHEAADRVSYEPLARIGIARILYERGNEAAAESQLDWTLLGQTHLEAWGFAASKVPEQRCINVGGAVSIPNYGYVAGLYPARKSGPDRFFRPTSAQAALRFGTVATPPAILTIRMGGGRPEGAPPPQTELFMNHTSLGRLPVSARWRVYQFLTPATTHGVQVTFQSDTFIPVDFVPQSEDTRAYGLALDWAYLNVLSTKHDAQPATRIRRDCALAGTTSRR